MPLDHQSAPPAELHREVLPLETVMVNFEGSFLKLLYRFRIPPEYAEDVLHEVYEIALRKKNTIRSPYEWLRGTLKKKAIMYWRTYRTHTTREQAVAPSFLELWSEPVEPDAERINTRMLIAACMAQLSHREQLLLKLRYFLGWNDSEIAEKMGYRPSGIRKIAHRARRKFMEALQSLSSPSVPIDVDAENTRNGDRATQQLLQELGITLAEDIATILRKFPLEEAEVFLRIFFLNQELKEVATVMNIPSERVLSLKKRTWDNFILHTRALRSVSPELRALVQNFVQPVPSHSTSTAIDSIPSKLLLEKPDNPYLVNGTPLKIQDLVALLLTTGVNPKYIHAFLLKVKGAGYSDIAATLGYPLERSRKICNAVKKRLAVLLQMKNLGWVPASFLSESAGIDK